MVKLWSFNGGGFRPLLYCRVAVYLDNIALECHRICLESIVMLFQKNKNVDRIFKS